jgi:fatty-acyl-CoA synthase
MYPGDFAATTPDKPAVILAGTGQSQSYRELFDGANRLSRLLQAAGLSAGDHYAILAENHLRYFEITWAGLNCGLYVTPINSHLTAPEVAYLVADSGASVLITTAALADVAEEIVPLTPGVTRRLMLDGISDHYESLEQATAEFSAEPLVDAPRGNVMLYSSGTTGRPKGIRFPLPDHPATEGDVELLAQSRALLDLEPSTVYLSPAPLYHAAPLRVSSLVHCTGGTVIVMDKFDPEQALQTIERYRVTSSQWVPTMFVRLLKLDPDVRTRYDLSSLRIAVHAAAPCPPEVKRQMIEWWGPILTEYYSGTENIGTTILTSAEWLEHPGSVGRAYGSVIHICREDGTEVPGRVDPDPSGKAHIPESVIGTVYFDTPSAEFSYHNNAEKTAAAAHPAHRTWRTLGDVGYLDTAGYLYLTDRRDFTIIAGGVNIYPREIEDVLIGHDAVADVAVFGIPHPELGEQVTAVVQPLDWDEAGEELANRLLDHCDTRLARFKLPRSITFTPQLPRLDNGKLYKKQLRDAYWQ